MAARTRRIQINDKTRAKIQTSQIVNRLTDHMLNKVEMSSTQVKAAEILLRKSLPDLTQVNGPGEEGEHTLNVIHESR